MQGANVAAVRLAVADLHPAGFAGGLLPFTIVLNGEGGDGRERPTANIERKRERKRKDGGVSWEGEMARRGGSAGDPDIFHEVGYDILFV